MAIYGLQADVEKNQNKGVSLYEPGKTQLTSGDVFLGGPGTGVTDAMLGQGVTRVFGDTSDHTAQALDGYLKDTSTSVKSAIAGAAPRIYGLQADIDANAGKQAVNLFEPGKTQMTPQDVFLGGQGTGVTDAMLNGGQRVFGNTSADTSAALDNYKGDLSSQIKAAIAANYAPRVDAAMGMPTGARLDMENAQAQNAISNNLAQKTFDHGVAQDKFSNEYNVGNLMGNYKGQDTLSKQAQAIQANQFDKTFNNGKDEFGRTLAYNYANSAANRAIDQQNADNNELAAGITRTGGGTVSGGSMPAEYSGWVNDAAAKNGIPPAILAGLIEAESSWDPNNVNKVSGATGLGQFLAKTGDEEGVNRTDAKSSIYGAAAYLAKRIQWAGGDLNKGIMGYGEGTPEYLQRVLDKSKNYTISEGTKTIGTKPTDKINTNELVGRLNTLYTTKDSDGVTSVNPDTKSQLRTAIIGQGLSDQETDQLLLYYGLPVNK